MSGNSSNNNTTKDELLVERAAYTLGRLLGSAYETFEGSVAMRKCEEVTEKAVKAGVIVPSDHNVWKVYDMSEMEDAPILPDEGYGFRTRRQAWCFWFGYGCPDGVEIRKVVDPELDTLNYESIVEKLKSPEVEVIDGGGRKFPWSEGHRPTLRVVR